MSIRVAIVEDNDALRGSMAMLIGGSRGFELIGSYSDAESAMEGLPKNKPDVVLMDIQLPKQSGIECVRKIKPDLKAQVIILSIYQDEERVFEALRAGAVGYLSKDTPPVEILEAIEDAHCGGSPMSSGIARMVVAHFQFQTKAAPANPPSPGPRLSPREEEIVELLVKGYRYKEVADHFTCSIHTVREHLRRIYEKLHVTSSREAVVKYLRTERKESRI
jgi:DNA-binding NarL/FixJ family response regulator